MEKNTCGIKSGARPEKNGAGPEKNRGTPRKTGLSGQSGREREIPEAQHEACVRHASSSAPASSNLRFDREERVPVKQIYYKHGNSAEGKYYPLSVTSCSVGHMHGHGTFKFAFHGTLERGIPSVAKSVTRSVGLERCEQALSMLRNDVMTWSTSCARAHRSVDVARARVRAWMHG